MDATKRVVYFESCGKRDEKTSSLFEVKRPLGGPEAFETPIDFVRKKTHPDKRE